MSATCCSILQTQVHRSEADLARIARLASWTGTPTARQLSLIAEAKAMLADQWGEWVPSAAGLDRITYGGRFIPASEASGCVMSHEELIHRSGKKAAGRLLDGRTWDQYPEQVVTP